MRALARPEPEAAADRRAALDVEVVRQAILQNQTAAWFRPIARPKASKYAWSASSSSSRSRRIQSGLQITKIDWLA